MGVAADPRAFTRDLLRWGRANRRHFPWRTETDPFRILVAEVLLQRSRGKTVAKVYEALFDRWPDAEMLAKARTSSIRAVIRPLGLTRRAEILRNLARSVVELFGRRQEIRGLRFVYRPPLLPQFIATFAPV